MEQAKGTKLTTTLPELKFLFLSLRPRQWSKNLIIYFAFFFAINQLWNSDTPTSIIVPALRASAAFLIFCAVSGAVYLINDRADLENDRVHPIKHRRPMASGKLRWPIALSGVVILLAGSIPLAFILELWLGIIAIAYLALMVIYSIAIKHVPILDVMAIGTGFVLRAAAGAMAIGVPISPWLYLTTSLGALFIGFGKRRCELNIAGKEGKAQRSVLGSYSHQLLDQLLAITAATTIAAYVLYTFTAENLPDNNAMMLTIPLVVFGLFRYLFLIHKRNLGQTPEEVFLSDPPIIGAMLIWLATAATVLLYFGR
jgi:4-hydroxybenzoate polyprenyltransferase